MTHVPSPAPRPDDYPLHRPWPGFSVSWTDDRRYRMNPEVVTRQLRRQVPMLDFVGWRVERIAPGHAEVVLPLTAEGTNQHFTHQGANIVLLGDYTAGTALVSLLPGWRVVGVHPVDSPDSVSMWLLGVEIEYLQPSVADLTAVATIPPERWPRIHRRFLAGRAVVERIPVRFLHGGETIARAVFTVYARQTKALRSDGTNREEVHQLYRLRLTSSAELVAGVRAHTSGTLFDDPYAAAAAGVHGMALARRFMEQAPELGEMIAARTAHLDRVMREFVDAGGRDVVLLGAGWDMRPFRLRWPEGTTFYEADFPTTLDEREARVREAGIPRAPGVRRVAVPIDLHTMDVADVLRDRLPADRPVLIAWEGVTMYFEEPEVHANLAAIRRLLRHPGSRAWIDLMSRDAIDHPERHPASVGRFLDMMQVLGEPFLFGVDDVPRFMSEHGLACREVVTAGEVAGKADDPVFGTYRLCVVSAGA